MRNFYLKSCQLLLVAVLFVCAWQPSKAQITKMKEGQTVESVLAGSSVQPENSSENEWTVDIPLYNSKCDSLVHCGMRIKYQTYSIFYKG